MSEQGKQQVCAPQSRSARALCEVMHVGLAQGAATTVYAATAPGLDAQSGAYLYDCKVQKSSKLGQDMDLAARLWTTTEQQLSQVLKDGKLQ